MEALNERRRQVVECRKQGMTLEATGALCGMCVHTVHGIWKSYCEGGMEAIVVNKTGRPVGKGRRLTSEQERDAQKVIADRTPDQLKSPYALWSRQAVREIIERRYERKLSVGAVGLYLRRRG